MIDTVVKDPLDTIVGVSVSPKIMNGPNGVSKVGFYVIKIWNKDCSAFHTISDLHLLHPKLVSADVMYTPHVDKKM